MMLIVSESGTVFIYEKFDLRWSAKLPILPLCILKANVGVSENNRNYFYFENPN